MDQPNSELEHSKKVSFAEENTHPALVPMKRKHIDDVPSSQSEATSVFEVPPKRRRKEQRPCSSQSDCSPPLPTDTPTLDAIKSNSQSPLESTLPSSPKAVTPHIPPSDGTGRTSLPSSFALQTPVDSAELLFHLRSMLVQCQETSDRVLSHQAQRNQHNRELEADRKDEVERLRRKLDQVTSMLVREREAHAQLRDAFSEMTKKFEKTREQNKNVAASLAEESVAVARLVSELAEERRKLALEQTKLREIEAARDDVVLAIEKAKKKVALDTEAIRAELASGIEMITKEVVLKIADAQAKGSRREKMFEDRANRKNEQLTLLAGEKTQLQKELDDERLFNAQLKKHNNETERQLVTFHFGANILTSYFWVMLHDNKIRRISSNRKVVDDVHDLWDVQASLKRLVDGCTPFLDNIPGRLDFYGDAGCPMCPPETVSGATAVPPLQKKPVIKRENVEVSLSRLKTGR